MRIFILWGFAMSIVACMCLGLTVNHYHKRSRAALHLDLRSRVTDLKAPDSIRVVHTPASWQPAQTAIIICDMWDEHWCKSATRRVAEMAPSMNKVLSIARSKGILIVHAPSDCMHYYEDYPQRKVAVTMKNNSTSIAPGESKLPQERHAVWPIDQSDGGCPDTPVCTQRTAWKKEIGLLQIEPADVISDAGEEIGPLLDSRGISNVILMGVHTNMCIVNRSFGIRSLTRLKKNVVLMRDMTDAMYDPRRWPQVNHFTGVGLMTQYIEKYLCPTVLSTDLTGTSAFRFIGDARPAGL